MWFCRLPGSCSAMPILDALMVLPLRGCCGSRTTRLFCTAFKFSLVIHRVAADGGLSSIYYLYFTVRCWLCCRFFHKADITNIYIQAIRWHTVMIKYTDWFYCTNAVSKSVGTKHVWQVNRTKQSSYSDPAGLVNVLLRMPTSKTS